MIPTHSIPTQGCAGCRRGCSVHYAAFSARHVRAPMGVMAVAALAVFGFFVLIYLILVLAHIV